MTGLKAPAILFMLALTALAVDNAWARGGSSGANSNASTHSSDRDSRARTQDMSATPGTAADTTAAERNRDSTDASHGTYSEKTGTPAPSGAMGTASEGSGAQAVSHRSAVIRFEKGQSALTQSDQSKLRNLITSIGADNIDRIEVVSWSDRPFPRGETDLAKTDRDLADQRSSRIQDYLKSQLNVSGTRIKTFNMAESSNWLARTMRTDDAELKSLFAKEGSTPVHREDFNYISKEGAPSRSVVVVVRK